MCHGKICSAASAAKAEGTSCCVPNDLIKTATNDPDFLRKVITGDKWWVYGSALEAKAQSSQGKPPGSPRPRKGAAKLQRDQDHGNCGF